MKKFTRNDAVKGALALAGGLILFVGFQNCGQGFQTMTGSSDLGSQTTAQTHLGNSASPTPTATPAPGTTPPPMTNGSPTPTPTTASPTPTTTPMPNGSPTPMPSATPRPSATPNPTPTASPTPLPVANQPDASKLPQAVQDLGYNQLGFAEEFNAPLSANWTTKGVLQAGYFYIGTDPSRSAYYRVQNGIVASSKFYVEFRFKAYLATTKAGFLSIQTNQNSNNALTNLLFYPNPIYSVSGKNASTIKLKSYPTTSYLTEWHTYGILYDGTDITFFFEGQEAAKTKCVDSCTSFPTVIGLVNGFENSKQATSWDWVRIWTP